jgi:hypothetical protein
MRGGPIAFDLEGSTASETRSLFTCRRTKREYARLRHAEARCRRSDRNLQTAAEIGGVRRGEIIAGRSHV